MITSTERLGAAAKRRSAPSRSTPAASLGGETMLRIAALLVARSYGSNGTKLQRNPTFTSSRSSRSAVSGNQP